jgi:integrase
VGAGLSGSKVRNVLVPCQALYRRHRRQVLADPTDGLDLPEAGGRRERVASPVEAAALLAAVPDEHRAIWATAAYAGLRRGELRALRVRDVSEKAVSVAHAWDDVEGEKGPKSAALTPSYVRTRANKAWAAAGLDWIGLHELRHSYSTWLDAAEISETRADHYMGHSNPSVANRYRHALPGQLAEDAERLDAYLDGATAGKVVALTGAHTGAQAAQSRMVAHGV